MAKSDMGLLASTMVWESARPYLYMRTTGDGRLLVGGDDDNIDIPARRDRRVEGKAKGSIIAFSARSITHRNTRFA